MQMLFLLHSPIQVEHHHLCCSHLKYASTTKSTPRPDVYLLVFCGLGTARYPTIHLISVCPPEVHKCVPAYLSL